ncbi:MAG: YkgJ family cysteine cluster protein [Polyangiaceae bacterium]
MANSPAMATSLGSDGTDAGASLCVVCGLCCDGSLFGRVPLDVDERSDARRRRLDVVANGSAFAQPCHALISGEDRTCAIYEDRPRACRRFTCVLRVEVSRGARDVAQAHAIVARTRALLRTTDAGDTEARTTLGALVAEHFARST